MPGQTPMVVTIRDRDGNKLEEYAVTGVVEPDAGYGLRVAESGERLVVGLGNPTLSDDGVGRRVIDALDELGHVEASLQQACVGGASLMEILVGCRRAIIVDAIIDPEETPGSGKCRPLAVVETRTPAIWTRGSMHRHLRVSTSGVSSSSGPMSSARHRTTSSRRPSRWPRRQSSKRCGSGARKR